MGREEIPDGAKPFPNAKVGDFLSTISPKGPTDD